MTVQQSIETKIADALNPLHLEVINESANHNVPEGSESHFKVTAVSEQFASKSLVNRHRLVNQILADELRGPIHALSLHTLTPEEWYERSGGVSESPPCLGGSGTSS